MRIYLLVSTVPRTNRHWWFFARNAPVEDRHAVQGAIPDDDRVLAPDLIILVDR